MKVNRPRMPNEVKRKLRQEAGFGCARCGQPFVEYHHIVPFSEEKHFRTEDMVAACPSCHALISKLSREEQYKIKKTPYNISNNTINGSLYYSKNDLLFLFGGSKFKNTPILLQFRETSIIECIIEDNQCLVSIKLFDQSGNTIIEIKKNDIEFAADNLWDFEYGHNWIKVRHALNNVILELDFRPEFAEVHGSFWLEGREVKATPSKIDIPGRIVISGGYYDSCGVGIQIK